MVYLIHAQRIKLGLNICKFSLNNLLNEKIILIKVDYVSHKSFFQVFLNITVNIYEKFSDCVGGVCERVSYKATYVIAAFLQTP